MAEAVVGLIGGTGPQGRGLAMRLALAGLPVLVGSRDAERAAGIAAELTATALAQSPGASVSITGQDNATVAAGADLLLLTVPFDNAPDMVRDLAPKMKPGAVFVDVTVPLSFKGGVQVVVPPEGSGSKHLRTLLPEGTPLVGAFKTLPAHVLEALELPMACNTFIYGDNAEARQRVMDMAARIPTLLPLDVGGLSAAATVEGMTAVLIRINRKTKSKEGRFSVVGLPAGLPEGSSDAG